MVEKTVSRTDSVTGAGTPITESWTYTYPWDGSTTGTVTAPDGGITQRFFLGSPPVGLAKLLWKEETPDHDVIEKYWEVNEPYIGAATAADRKNAYVRTDYRKPAGGAYAATVTEQDKNGNVTSVKEYDYSVTVPRDGQGRPNGPPSSGTVLRTTTHKYHYEADPAPTSNPQPTAQNAYWSDFSIEFKGARKRTTILNGNGVAESATELVYDNAKTTANVLSQAAWDSNRGALPATLGQLSAANSAVAGFQWSKGNLLSQTGPDPGSGGDVTAFAYGQVPGCPTNYTSLYPTRVTRHQGQGALAEVSDFVHDCATGLLTKTTREPDQTAKAVVSSAGYDVYGRNTFRSEATGTSGAIVLRQTQTQYNDLDRWVRVASSLDGATDLRLASVYGFDGMGRLESVRGTDDGTGAVTASSANGVLTQRAMRYVSGEGRYELESTPFRPVATTTMPATPQAWVRRKVDRSGRLAEVRTFKGALLPAPWGTNVDAASWTTYSYAGNLTTVTDAAGRSRLETRDGLGRLKAVLQGSVGADYTYYGRDLLYQVTQTDSTHGSPYTQVRTFVHDSLGRLKSATNPESGTTSYGYDVDGLLQTRTDARNPAVTVTMTYDGAQRLKTKTYTDNTPAVTYCYDGEVYTGAGCGPLANRASDAADAPKGRLTGFGSAAAWTNHTRIDALGRTLLVDQQVTGLGTKTLVYEYAANGAVKKVTYPSGRQVSYALSDAGRVTAVNGLLSAQNTGYLTQATYGAAGMALGWKLANSAVEETHLPNWLGQMTELEVKKAGARLLKLTNGYGDTGNNGNLLSQTTDTGSRTFSHFFGYDNANRLRMAVERLPAGGDLNTTTCAAIQTTWPSGQWCLRYEMDTFGNTWAKEVYGARGLLQREHTWYVRGSVVDNRMAGVNYDLAGNQTQLEPNNVLRVADYDGENRLTKIRDTGTTPSTVVGEYAYDGEGRRVKRVAGGVTTYYVYGLDGKVVAEYPSGGTAAAGVTYAVADQLGSVRLTLDGTGTVVARHDYEPYGVEIDRTGEGYGAVDPTAHRFTGQTRDTETANSGNPSGLDYFGARYLAASLGRFTSPDEPFAGQSPSNPQSWNMYAYALGNPLTITDPTGREPCVNGINPLNGNICTDVVVKESSPSRVMVKERAESVVGAAKELYNMLFGVLNYTPAGLLYKELAGKPGVESLRPVSTNEYRGMQEVRLASQFMIVGELTIPAEIQSAAQAIAHGHAFRKHGSQFTRFGVANEQQFQGLVREVIENAKGANLKNLSGGRSAYWDDARGMVVIHDPSTPDKGTAFIPNRGRAYFDGLR